MTRRRCWVGLVLAGLSGLSTSCVTEHTAQRPLLCEPFSVRACEVWACAGTQLCAADGSGFGPCLCAEGGVDAAIDVATDAVADASSVGDGADGPSPEGADGDACDADGRCDAATDGPSPEAGEGGATCSGCVGVSAQDWASGGTLLAPPCCAEGRCGVQWQQGAPDGATQAGCAEPVPGNLLAGCPALGGTAGCCLPSGTCGGLSSVGCVGAEWWGSVGEPCDPVAPKAPVSPGLCEVRWCANAEGWNGGGCCAGDQCGLPDGADAGTCVPTGCSPRECPSDSYGEACCTETGQCGIQPPWMATCVAAAPSQRAVQVVHLTERLGPLLACARVTTGTGPVELPLGPPLAWLGSAVGAPLPDAVMLPAGTVDVEIREGATTCTDGVLVGRLSAPAARAYGTRTELLLLLPDPRGPGVAPRLVQDGTDTWGSRIIHAAPAVAALDVVTMAAGYAVAVRQLDFAAAMAPPTVDSTGSTLVDTDGFVTGAVSAVTLLDSVASTPLAALAIDRPANVFIVGRDAVADRLRAVRCPRFDSGPCEEAPSGVGWLGAIHLAHLAPRVGPVDLCGFAGSGQAEVLPGLDAVAYGEARGGALVRAGSTAFAVPAGAGCSAPPLAAAVRRVGTLLVLGDAGEPDGASLYLREAAGGAVVVHALHGEGLVAVSGGGVGPWPVVAPDGATPSEGFDAWSSTTVTLAGDSTPRWTGRAPGRGRTGLFLTGIVGDALAPPTLLACTWSAEPVPPECETLPLVAP